MDKEIKKQIGHAIDQYNILPSITVELADEIERIVDSCPLENMVMTNEVVGGGKEKGCNTCRFFNGCKVAELFYSEYGTFNYCNTWQSKPA